MAEEFKNTYKLPRSGKTLRSNEDWSPSELAEADLQALAAARVPPQEKFMAVPGEALRDVATTGVGKLLEILGKMDPQYGVPPIPSEIPQEFAKGIVPQTRGELLTAAATLPMMAMKPATTLGMAVKQAGKRAATEAGAAALGAAIESKDPFKAGLMQGVFSLGMEAFPLFRPAWNALRLRTSAKVLSDADLPRIVSAINESVPEIPTIIPGTQTPVAGPAITKGDRVSDVLEWVRGGGFTQFSDEYDAGEVLIKRMVMRTGGREAEQAQLKSIDTVYRGLLSQGISEPQARQMATARMQQALAGTSAWVEPKFSIQPLNIAMERDPNASIPFSTVLQDLKKARSLAYGDTSLPKTLTEAGFDPREAYRDASMQFRDLLFEKSPRASALYDAIRDRYHRGRAVIEFLGPKGKGEDAIREFQEIFMPSRAGPNLNIRTLQNRLTVEEVPGMRDLGLDPLVEAVQRGAPTGARDALWGVHGGRLRLPLIGATVSMPELGFRAFAGGNPPVPAGPLLSPVGGAQVETAAYTLRKLLGGEEERE